MMRRAYAYALCALICVVGAIEGSGQPACGEDVGRDALQPAATQEEAEAAGHETAGSFSFSANLAIVSDYRFRGISQTMRRPAVQGGFDLAHTSGVYIGTWASNVDGSTHFYNNCSMEWDFYGGIKGAMPGCTQGWTYNVGAYYYYYPGGEAYRPRRSRHSTGEWFVELGYRWLTVRYYQTFTNYYGICSHNPPYDWRCGIDDRGNGGSRGSSYVECNATFELCRWCSGACLPEGKLTLSTHAGHQTVRHYGHLSYSDWKVMVTGELPWFNVIVAYVGTNARGAYYDVPDNAYKPSVRRLGAQGFVGGVLKSF